MVPVHSGVYGSLHHQSQRSELQAGLEKVQILVTEKDVNLYQLIESKLHEIKQAMAGGKEVDTEIQDLMKKYIDELIDLAGRTLFSTHPLVVSDSLLIRTQ